jgi:hypothetical protein
LHPPGISCQHDTRAARAVDGATIFAVASSENSGSIATGAAWKRALTSMTSGVVEQQVAERVIARFQALRSAIAIRQPPELVRDQQQQD